MLNSYDYTLQLGAMEVVAYEAVKTPLMPIGAMRLFQYPGLLSGLHYLQYVDEGLLRKGGVIGKLCFMQGQSILITLNE